jgi:hypothetical protein
LIAFGEAGFPVVNEIRCCKIAFSVEDSFCKLCKLSEKANFYFTPLRSDTGLNNCNPMKYLIFFFFLGSLFFTACQNDPAADDPFSVPADAPDSVKVKILKSYVDYINEHRRFMEPIKTKPNIYSEEDKLLAAKDSLGNLVFARLDLVGEDTVYREYFYLKDGKVANYQLMVWNKIASPPYAWGFNLYMYDKGVAGAEERYVELTTDERPAKLLTQPPMPPKVDADSMARLVKKRMEPVWKELEKYKSPSS